MSILIFMDLCLVPLHLRLNKISMKIEEVPHEFNQIINSITIFQFTQKISHCESPSQYMLF